MKKDNKEEKTMLMEGLKDVLSSFNFGFIGKIKKEHQKENQIKTTYEMLSDAATPSKEFYILMLLSTIIATAGLIQNSAAVVIGAMLVAPLMTPILAFSLGVIWGDFKLMGRSMWSIIRGVGIALAIAFFISLITPFTDFPKEIMIRTNPRLFDIIIALASGFVGGYAYANKKIFSSLPGVAIAVALLPPLSVIGIGLGKMRFDIALGSTILFIINLLSIMLASSIIFLIIKIHPKGEEEGAIKRAWVQILFTGFLLFSIGIPVTYFTYKDIKMNKMKEKIDREVKTLLPFDTISDSHLTEKDGKVFYRVTILTNNLPEEHTIKDLKKKMSKNYKNITIEMNFIEEIKF